MILRLKANQGMSFWARSFSPHLPSRERRSILPGGRLILATSALLGCGERQSPNVTAEIDRLTMLFENSLDSTSTQATAESLLVSLHIPYSVVPAEQCVDGSRTVQVCEGGPVLEGMVRDVISIRIR